jgi:cell division protein FtsZ
VKTIMSNQGLALMGTGRLGRANRAVDAAHAAIHSPAARRDQHRGRDGHPHQHHGRHGLRCTEVNEAVGDRRRGHEDANIIFGLLTDPDMGDVVKVTAIATGFGLDASQMQEIVHASAQGKPRNALLSLPQTQRVSVPARTSVSMAPAASRPSMAPAPRQSGFVATASSERDTLRASRRVSTPPEQTSLPSVQAHGRAFGAAALHDEATLDIPAYLRRASIAD